MYQNFIKLTYTQCLTPDKVCENMQILHQWGHPRPMDTFLVLYELLISSPSSSVIALLIWIHHMSKNSLDPDQWKPADLDLHCFYEKKYNITFK